MGAGGNASGPLLGIQYCNRCANIGSRSPRASQSPVRQRMNGPEAHLIGIGAYARDTLPRDYLPQDYLLGTRILGDYRYGI
ncbi:hypothetical protein D3C80_1979200 [compost metagenome]